MNGINLHIKSHYPSAVYSETYFLQSAAGTNYVQKEFDNPGAIALLIANIYWVPQNTGAQINFFDYTGLPIFSTVDNFTLPNWAPLNYCRGGQILKITSSMNLIFSVSFQYLLNERK